LDKKIILIMQKKILKDNLTTIILCGGKGKRLFPLTKSLPKPLVKINGTEILTYILKNQLKYNLKDIIIATGYKHKYFKNYQKKNNKKFKIKLVNTNVKADIIQRIIKCEKYCKDYVMVCYGDTIVDINIDKLIKFFLINKKNIVLSSYNLKSQFGLMKITRSGKVKSFEEKPNLNLFFNIGYFLFKRDKFKYIKNFSSFKKFLENKNSLKMLRSFIHKGNHITVNTLNELNDAKKKLKNLN
tara:strand:- start:961 stop:1686 length:726 start_codon:yes stop_codon:yes gene_type:complete